MATGTIQNHPRRVLLWSNSGNIPAGTTITLSSSDYEFLEIEYVRSTGTAGNVTPYIQRFKKGTNITLFACQVTEGGAVTDSFIISRLLTRVSDTQFTADGGMMARWGKSSVETAASNICVPKAIYGITY